VSDSREHVELRGSATSTVTLEEWQARVDELTLLLTDAGLSPEQIADDLRETFAGITFRDADDHSWRHDGASWWRWDASGWEAHVPPSPLILDRVEFEVEPETAETATDGFEQLPFRPTHTVPASGMPAWSTPDPTGPTVATLDPGLDIELLEQRVDGMANIRCSNDWTAWVDGRQLVPDEHPR
jgi:hypothetical protein